MQASKPDASRASSADANKTRPALAAADDSQHGLSDVSKVLSDSLAGTDSTALRAAIHNAIRRLGAADCTNDGASEVHRLPQAMASLIT